MRLYSLKLSYRKSSENPEFGAHPGATLGKLVEDAAALGKCLGYAAAELSEHSQHAYEVDLCVDIIEDLVDLFNNGELTPRERRIAIRSKRNKVAIDNGITATTNAALNVINSMKGKNIEENVTDALEMIFDLYLTDKAIQGVLYASNIMGSKLLQAAEKLNEIIPAPIMDEAVILMKTSTGDIIAVTEKTGKDLSIVASNQIAINRAVQIEKIAEKEKLINNTIDKITKGNAISGIMTNKTKLKKNAPML